MEKTLNIYQRVREVMREVAYIQKGDKKVNGQYAYVSHDDVAAAIHPQLVKHGIVIVPTEEELIQEGNRTHIIMKFTFVNVDTPEESLTLRFSGYGVDNGDKGPGKAYTYAYKYALLKMFCLETGTEDDVEKTPNAAHEKGLNDKQKKAIQAAAAERNMTADELLVKVGFPALNEILPQYFEVLKEAVKRKFPLTEESDVS